MDIAVVPVFSTHGVRVVRGSEMAPVGDEPWVASGEDGVS